MIYAMPKSKRGATRQWNAILRAYRRGFAGGGAFGFDWPTMRLNSPNAYAHLMTLARLFDQLPE
jgi:hypothetical protein